LVVRTLAAIEQRLYSFGQQLRGKG